MKLTDLFKKDTWTKSLPERFKTYMSKPATKRDMGVFAVYFVLAIIVYSVGTYAGIHYLSQDLPDHRQLEEKIINQSLSTLIYSSDGELLRTVGEESGKRFWVKYEDIPQCMIDAVIAAEDSRFFDHWGVSLIDIFRAFIVNIKETRIRWGRFPFIIDLEIAQGASTITQQLARDIFLDRRTTFTRKFKEMIVAVNIERTYSKSQILEFFLNRMFFGSRSFGIQAASRTYFGKPAKELDVGEAALLAGLLQSPSRYNPRNEERRPLAEARRNVVLTMMVNTGKITPAKAAEEKGQPIEISHNRYEDFGKAPYFVNYALDELKKEFGEDEVYTGGLKVYTTIDYRLQQAAEQAIQKQLAVIQESGSWKLKNFRRDPEMSDYEAYRDSLAKTQVQGALVAVDVRTGAILAMVGGREFDYFNRAVHANRQAGSSFKAFVYTAAVDNGWCVCDVIMDSYFALEDEDGQFWEPQNYNELEYEGALTLRNAFRRSKNVISIKLVNDMDNGGIGPYKVVQYARKMGITTPISAVPSIAVGTAPVKLIEMTSAFTVFPNHGIKTQNFCIDNVIDKNGMMAYEQPAGEGRKSDAIRSSAASLMLSMLKSVASSGTAAGMHRMGMDYRPAAGKTGTGQDYKDAWFIGFTPYISCGVWVGFDSEETTLEETSYRTGSKAALPAWVEFMVQASEILDLPEGNFSYPGVTSAQVCRETHLNPTPQCPVYSELFIPGTQYDRETCYLHGNRQQRQDDGRFIHDVPEDTGRDEF